MSIAIRIENLSKQYRLGLIGTGTLSHDLRRWYHLVRGKEDPYLKIGEVNDRSIKGTSDYIWALKDINLEIDQGDVVGIIGKNGAGKSTLLKILSRVTAPTTGRITYQGRIASLLEVGTGFHPELTGRENIFLNGSILGMRKREIEQKFDEIVDFSGCERYIDTPVKRYSSGMIVRLGFAVAAFLEPEILVVDEVLAVGDAEFQKKAIGKMQDVSKKEGRTVLFVSHNMGAVKNLCNSCVLIENGCIKKIGDVSSIIDLYINDNLILENNYHPKNSVVKVISAVQERDKIILSLKYRSEEFITQPNFGFILYNSNGNTLFGTNPIFDGVLDFGDPKKEGEVQVTISSPFLVDGIYPISIWFIEGKDFEKQYFIKEKCISLTVSNMNNSFIEKAPVLGPIIPICDWKFI
jgi:lipopolysaccharide transport system ATP-binding protein